MRLPVLIICFFASVPVFCQQEKHFISADSALTIANNYKKFNSSNAKQHDWAVSAPQLDTVNAVWEVTTTKGWYQNRGKTTKNFTSDSCQPCKRVNGCHVRKTKTVLIDAITGRVIRIKKDKRVYGNYE